MERTLNEIIDQLGIRAQVEALPYYKGARNVNFDALGLPPAPKGLTCINPGLAELKGNYIYVTKNTLPEVRELVGVTEKSEPDVKRGYTVPINREDFESLPPVRQAVWYMTQPGGNEGSRALWDFADREDVQRFILNTASELPVFLADELVIENGQSIKAEGTIVLVFRHLAMKGTGKLDLTGNYYVKVVTQRLTDR